MTILTFPLGELQANCYFLIQYDECLIIDPGDSAEFILEEIQRRNLKVKGIIATHGHFDHILAIGEIQLSLESYYQENLPVYIHNKDLFLVKRLSQTAHHFLGHKPQLVPIKKIEPLEPGELNIGSFTIKVEYTPGHTPGSCCFYFDEEKALFTGDTLFKDSIGDYSHSYSDKHLLKQSVNKLLEHEDIVTIYPGHGDSALIDELR